MKNKIILLIPVFVIFFTYHARAERVEVDESGQSVRSYPAQKTGKKAASKYMGHNAEDSDEGEERHGIGSREHYMAVYAGPYIDSKTYKCGDEGKGKFLVGVSYRLGEWLNSTDFLLRANINSFEVDGERPTKISLMPVLIFPDARSQFPLYFGAGIGAGIFFKQVSGESSLSLDYTVLVGVRIFNAFDKAGFMFEVGLDNHIHLFSDGQFNSPYAVVGTVFEF